MYVINHFNNEIIMLLLFIITASGVPDVGELMLASFPHNQHFQLSISQSNPW